MIPIEQYKYYKTAKCSTIEGLRDLINNHPNNKYKLEVNFGYDVISRQYVFFTRYNGLEYAYAISKEAFLHTSPIYFLNKIIDKFNDRIDNVSPSNVASDGDPIPTTVNTWSWSDLEYVSDA